MQRGRGGDETQDGRVVLFVVAKASDRHLHFVLKFPRKKRAYGAVDEAAGEDRFVRRPALALNEARRFYFPGGVQALLKIDHERKKVDAGANAAEDHRREHDGVAVARFHRSGGLFSEGAGRERELAAAPLDRIFLLGHIVF